MQRNPEDDRAWFYNKTNQQRNKHELARNNQKKHVLLPHSENLPTPTVVRVGDKKASKPSGSLSKNIVVNCKVVFPKKGVGKCKK